VYVRSQSFPLTPLLVLKCIVDFTRDSHHGDKASFVVCIMQHPAIAALVQFNKVD
jgi:hypothetical protein